ncbi:hypothetical protein MAE02_30540 [Microvirga aerophila]|uniref:Uncharacterized protein n=1 Tax=Microvirga aerophila TaxID=670291 RepID=A0A512BTP6_9HYPH|nr:hypothetical protein MAE02_30540 [Microvirga aerophila]
MARQWLNKSERLTFGWTIWVSLLALPEIDDGMMKRAAQLRLEAQQKCVSIPRCGLAQLANINGLEEAWFRAHHSFVRPGD